MAAPNVPTTVADIKARLACADEAEFCALERALAADPRKGVQQAVKTARRRLDAEAAEARRLAALYTTEQAWGPLEHIVGLDEVGRGPVAGPLTVGAVVLPPSPRIPGLNDSKQLSPEKRQELADAIKHVALAWAVDHTEPSDVDAHGMTACLRAAFRARHQSSGSAGHPCLDRPPRRQPASCRPAGSERRQRRRRLRLDFRRLYRREGRARCAHGPVGAQVPPLTASSTTKAMPLQSTSPPSKSTGFVRCTAFLSALPGRKRRCFSRLSAPSWLSRHAVAAVPPALDRSFALEVRECDRGYLPPRPAASPRTKAS